MNKFSITLCAIGLIFLSLSFCTSKEEKASVAQEVGSISTQDLRNRIGRIQNNAVILDVRTPAEVASGIIKGATVIDFKSEDFEDKVDKLDKSKTYFVYCRAGGRSLRAAELMLNLGFQNVINVEGGMSQWKEAGFEVVQIP